MSSERYLVTGGAGFIGSHLVNTLVNNGHPVRILDSFSTGHQKNLAPFSDRIEIIEGDLRDPETIRQAVAGMTYVLHHAALISVPQSIADPLLAHECNITGTLYLLQACREAGVKRIVMASSAAVYGDNPDLPKHERMPPESKSPYAISKLANEQYGKVFFESYGLETVSLRYFNVFGPRQDPNSPYAAVIPKFILRILKREAPMIHGDGLQSRDFIYVDDVVKANMLALTAQNAAGQVFNIASGQSYSLLDLVETLNMIIGTHLEPIHSEVRPGDIRHSEANIQAARTILEFEPTFDLHTGLERTVAWYQQQMNLQ